MAYKIASSLVNRIPDTCPSCNKGISPIYCYSYGKDEWRLYYGFLQVIYRCPREDCSVLFIAKYTKQDHSDESLSLNSSYILDIVEFEEFPQSVLNISEQFVKIYNQAKVAEENDLDLIAGPGYRKALEFLVKDYLIHLKSEIAEEVKQKQLGDAIKLISEKRIEACASRAAWVGNDETHYVRKWEDRDIKDLKNLIKMLVDWIDLVERSDEYVEAMPSKAPSEK